MSDRPVPAAAAQEGGEGRAVRHPYDHSCSCYYCSGVQPAPLRPSVEPKAETPAQGMGEHVWVCDICGRHREDEGIRGCNPLRAPAPEPPASARPKCGCLRQDTVTLVWYCARCGFQADAEDVLVRAALEPEG